MTTACNSTSWAKSMAYAPSKAYASAPWKYLWAMPGFWWRDLLISSRARRQPAVHAMLPCFLSWRKCLKKPRVGRRARLEALKKESDLAERDLIRRLLALPPEKRTHFLRKRVGIRMSCL